MKNKKLYFEYLLFNSLLEINYNFHLFETVSYFLTIYCHFIKLAWERKKKLIVCGLLSTNITVIKIYRTLTNFLLKYDHNHNITSYLRFYFQFVLNTPSTIAFQYFQAFKVSKSSFWSMNSKFK